MDGWMEIRKWFTLEGLIGSIIGVGKTGNSSVVVRRGRRRRVGRRMVGRRMVGRMEDGECRRD